MALNCNITAIGSSFLAYDFTSAIRGIYHYAKRPWSKHTISNPSSDHSLADSLTSNPAKIPRLI